MPFFSFLDPSMKIYKHVARIVRSDAGRKRQLWTKQFFVKKKKRYGRKTCYLDCLIKLTGAGFAISGISSIT